MAQRAVSGAGATHQGLLHQGRQGSEAVFLRLPIPARRRGLWLFIMLAVGILLHYGDSLPVLSTAAAHTPLALQNRQSLERVLFLLPVIYASIVFGVRGGLATLAFAAAAMLPRAVLGAGDLIQALLQTAGVSLTGGLFILWVASERRRVEHASALAQRVLVAQEQERQRIARELHDDTTQMLYVMAQRLERLASNCGSKLGPGGSSQVHELRGMAIQAEAGLRRLVQDLRPRILDDLGLVPALGWLAEEFTRLYGLPAHVELDGAPPDLPAEAQLLLWRIAQEALHNVGKHSAASKAVVSLRCTRSRLRMVIRDNGKGLDPARAMREMHRSGKLGLLGMQERARLLRGSLSMHSEPRRGASVVVEVPLPVRQV
ncbi:MAG: sensor histidine kinase [Chloroflexi bacterium]|nr:sensor histidine kinase [Chloroflexota bacterium]